MRVELITVGDELLLGYTIDTNGAFLGRELAAVGVELVRRTSVGDGAEAIAGAVREALDRTGAVITTGGLGPTSDDRTKPAVAALFGRAMRLDDEIARALEARWKARGWPGPLPVANRQQAMIPDGAEILTNRHGSAPGIWLEDDAGRWVAMLPGVPREARGMTVDTLVPRLRERLGAAAGVVRSLTIRTTGIAESAVADRLAELAGGIDGLALAYLPGPDGLDLRLTSRGTGGDAADAALVAAAAKLRERIGTYVYGGGDDDLAALVLERCRARGLRIAVAESCTGGMLGARLTAVPGSSDVFDGGIIAYSNEVKRAQLGVTAADLAAHGAVSEPVVRAMTTGVRERFGAGVGIAITGVAGPGGGTPEKPVGTVWVAGDVAGAVTARRLSLIGDREEIRRRATQAALDLVRRSLD
ncbi:MAG TPA: competence/damage-inducible protein A [Gemmatimonadaceae bacterium]|nr:competence/damage-inducible protein A [Gemmatimonadaceae bacterium]